jgi:hypothetical protein
MKRYGFFLLLMCFALTGGTLDAKAGTPQWKVMQVKCFTVEPGVQFPPGALSYFCSSLRKRLVKVGLAGQVLDESAVVPASEADDAVILEGIITNYTPTSGFSFKSGHLNMNVIFYRASDHRTIKSFATDIPPVPQHNDKAIGENAGFYTVYEIKRNAKNIPPLSSFSPVKPGEQGSADSATLIQQKMLSQIKLTKSTADHTDILTAGDIVELNKDGLMMCSTASASPYVNTYDAGVLTAIQPIVANPNASAQQAMQSAVVGAVASHFLGSLGGSIATGALNSVQAAQNAQAQAAQAKAACTPRNFVAGEKFWVTGIVAQPDGILVSTLSDPYSDVRYYGDIKFYFPPSPATVPAPKHHGNMPPPREAPPVDDFLKTVAELISVVPPEETSDQSSPADQGTQPAAAAAPAPLPEVAPPPPPADTPPLTIDLGQTRDEVLAIFGPPVKIAHVGAKEIFYYKDMKVTFTDGKVSNVE